MTIPKNNVIRLRLTDLEKRDWQEAAGGAGKMSEWIRSTCNAECEAIRHPLGVMKPQVVEDAIQRDVSGADADLISAEIARERAHRGSRSIPVAQAGGDDSSSGNRKAKAGASAPASAQCPRWFHHKEGVYCGACKKVIGK